MKVFIREYCRDVTIRIFGLDGEERTKEFFDKHFSDVRGVGKMSDEDRKENLSEAEYYIASYRFSGCCTNLRQKRIYRGRG